MIANVLLFMLVAYGASIRVEVFPPTTCEQSVAELSELSPLQPPGSLAESDVKSTLDPWGTDRDRECLPIGVYGTSSALFVTNATVCGVLCTVETVPDWDPSKGSEFGAKGVFLGQLPMGDASMTCDVSVTVQDADPVASVQLTVVNAVRYQVLDVVSRAKMEKLDSIGSTNGAAKAIVLGNLAGRSNTTEMLVADPSHDAGRGAAFVISVSSGLDIDTLNSFHASRDTFGFGLLLVGDANEDGSPFDVIVAEHNNRDRGQLHLYSLAPDGAAHRLDMRDSVGVDQYGWQGMGLTLLGDIDGDGRPVEIAVGVPRNNDGGDDHGMVFLFTFTTSGRFEYLSAMGRNTLVDAQFRSRSRFGYSIAHVPTIDDTYRASVVVGGMADLFAVSFNLDGTGIVHDSKYTGQGQADELIYLPFDLNMDGVANEVIVGFPGSSLVANQNGLLRVFSWSSNGKLAVERDIGSSFVHYNGRLGQSLAFVGDIRLSGVARSLFVYYDDSSDPKSIGYIADILDTSDRSGAAAVVGMAEPTDHVLSVSDLHTAAAKLCYLAQEVDLNSARPKPLVDSEGRDALRSVLPISVITPDSPTLTFIAVDGRLCEKAQWADGWPAPMDPKHFNPRRRGVMCIGPPPGRRNAMAKVAVGFHDGSGTYTIVQSAVPLVQYDDLWARSPDLELLSSAIIQSAHVLCHAGYVFSDGSTSSPLHSYSATRTVLAYSVNAQVSLVLLDQTTETVDSSLPLPDSVTVPGSVSALAVLGFLERPGDRGLASSPTDAVVLVGVSSLDQLYIVRFSLHLTQNTAGAEPLPASPGPVLLSGLDSVSGTSEIGASISVLDDPATPIESSSNDTHIATIIGCPSSDGDVGAMILLRMRASETGVASEPIVLSIEGAVAGDRVGESVASIGGGHLAVALAGSEQIAIVAIPEPLRQTSGGSHLLTPIQMLSSYPSAVVRPWGMPQSGDGICKGFLAATGNSVHVFEVHSLNDSAIYQAHHIWSGSLPDGRTVGDFVWLGSLEDPVSARQLAVLDGDSSDVDLYQLPTNPRIIRSDNIVTINVRRTTGGSRRPCTHGCRVSYLRGGDLADDTLIEWQLFFTYNLDPAVLQVEAASIGGVPCANAELRGWRDGDANLFRANVICTGLNIPTELIPPVESPDWDGSVVFLSGAALQLQVRSNATLWARDSVNHSVVEVLPNTVLPRIETRQVHMQVFVPISEQLSPAITATEQIPSQIEPHIPVFVAMHLSDILIAADPEKHDVVAWGLGSIEVVDYHTRDYEPSHSYDILDFVNSSAILCVAGKPSASVFVATLEWSMVVEQKLPPFPQPKLISFQVSNDELSVFGGTLIDIYGSGFGNGNLSDPASDISSICSAAWADAGLTTGRPDLVADPRQSVLWAYVGGVPCITTAWLGPSRVQCRAPPGIGKNVSVAVVVEGFIAYQSSAVSYEDVPPVLSIETAKGSSLPVDGREPINVTMAFASVLSDSLAAPGLIVHSVWIGPLHASLPADQPSTVSSSSSSSSFLKTLENLPAPPGAGANHSVRICFQQRTAAITAAAALWWEPLRESCSSVSGAAIVHYDVPEILSTSPSADLNPFGEDLLVIRGFNFGDPSILQAHSIPVTVELSGVQCLSILHVSTNEIRCTTQRLPQSVSTVQLSVDVGNQLSQPTSISVIRVSIISISPRGVQPAAPGRRFYDFVVSVLRPEEVESVVIAGIPCEHPIVTGTDTLLCRQIEAPTKWQSDFAWLIANGGSEILSRSAVLRAQPPPLIVAISTPQGVPTTGNVSIVIAGEGFGIGSPDFGGVVVGGSEQVAVATWKGQRESDAFVTPESKAMYFPNRNDHQSHGSGTSTWLSSNKVEITLPRGIGRNVPVRVATSWGLISPPESLSFDPPVPERVSPSTIRPGQVAAPVEVCGRSFPPEGSSATSVFVGGFPCFSVQVLSNTCLRCFVTTPGIGGLEEWGNELVVANVGGVEGSLVANLATFLPLPVLLNLNREVVAYTTTVRLTGSGFGADPEYIVAVIVGGDEATAREAFQLEQASVASYASPNTSVVVRDSVALVDETQVSFKMPNGAGANIALRVVTQTGLISSPIFVSYQTPTVFSIEPAVLLPGETNMSVVLTGSDFPPLPLFVDFFRIGGIECPRHSVQVESANALRCNNFSTPRSSSWPAHSVELSVAGQSVSSDSIQVVFVGIPIVTGILEASASEGDRITIIGRNFGASLDDIKTVWVGDQVCEAILWRSGTEVQCTIPDPHPLWRAALATDMVVPTVEVEVELSTGIVSNSTSLDANPNFVPQGLRLRPRPFITPSGTGAWRHVGRTSVIVVRWRYPGPALERFWNSQVDAVAEPALGTQFRLEAFPVRSNSSKLHGVGDSITLTVGRPAKTRPALSLENETNPDAWEWHQFSMPVGSIAPHFVRIRVENEDGAGPWTFVRSNTTTTPLWPNRGQVSPRHSFSIQGMPLDLQDSIPDACASDEFLATNLDGVPEDVACKTCPAGAVCAGLSAENVSALDGFWRVPWSRDSLGFARCYTPGACIGAPRNFIDLARAAAATDILPEKATIREMWEFADTRDRDVAVRNAQMVPSQLEKCRTGHSGTLCSSCADGFYATVDSVCLSCGGSAWTWIRALLVLLGVTVLFSLLLLRAWKSRSKSSSKPVQIVKIFVAHVQAISIIGAVQLRWPSAVRGLFAAVSSTSSFATSGLAFECVLGEKARDPYLRTLAVYLLPVFLLCYAAIFWALLAVAERYSRFVAFWLTISSFIPEDIDGSGKPTFTSAPSSAIPQVPKDVETRRLTVHEISRPQTAEPIRKQNFAKRRSIVRPSAFNADPWSLFKKRMYISFVVVMFVSHTPMSLAAFRLVTCQPVSPLDDPRASRYFLAMNMDMSCEDVGVFGGLLAMSIPVIILFSFGIPVAFAQYLRHVGGTKLQTVEWREQLGFLYTGYRDDYYFWEAVILFRKVLLALVSTVFAPMGAPFQLFSTILVILIAQIVHARSQPFVSRVINSLESLSMVASEMTLLTGLFIIANEENDEEESSKTYQAVQVTASVIIIFINVLFFITVCNLFSRRARRFFGEQYADICRRCTLRIPNMRKSIVFENSPTPTRPEMGTRNPLIPGDDQEFFFSSDMYCHPQSVQHKATTHTTKQSH